MIGNDIIDLHLAKINSRWKEQRFLDKLFTEKEQAFIFRDDFRYRNIWIVWSMKESAYKVFSRNFETPIFNPKSFQCHLISETKGSVSFGGQSIDTTSNVHENFIYTTAHPSNSCKVSEYVFFNNLSPRLQHQQLKGRAIKAFAHLKSITSNSISVRKNHLGVPQFYVNGNIQSEALSLTHHGNYGGFAISL